MSESKYEHSPLPWFVEDTTVYFRVRKDGYDSEPAVAECGPDTDATAWIDKESDDPKLTRRANADFIVRAVNSHEALVEAARFVKTFLNQLEDGLPEEDPLTQARRRYHAPIHAKIDAALALAEKES